MNTQRCLILSVLVTCIATAAQAGTFSRAAWTNDASSGITAGQTAWAYHFGATTTAVVNGVSVTGIAGPTASNAHFDLTGPTSVFNGDTNSLTALSGTGSAGIAGDFVYGGNPTTITLKGLTVGQSYAVSILSVGWITGQTRVQGFESDGDGLTIDPQFYGQDQGVRVDYVFTATATTRNITITPDVPSNTFHLYGLALRQTTGAGSLVVSNGFDSGTGSLRQTLADAAVASGANTLTFDAALSGTTLTLSSEIIINDATGAVTVDASSLPAGVTISGNNVTRSFSVSSGKSLALLGLTLTGGNGSGSVLSGNGGAIVNFGTLALTRCTLSGNSVGGSGSGGAILNFGGTLTLTLCTLSGNSAARNGGAIHQGSGTLTLSHCTFSGNQADLGGAIRKFSGALTLANTIAADNTAVSGAPDIFNGDGPITPTGVNFIGDTTSSGLVAGPSLLTTAANGPINLAPLGNYGGPTQTMPPLVGSSVIDRAVGSSATTDQRGIAIAGVPDIGAVENGSRVTTTADQLDTPVGADGSLREAVRDCPAGGVIDFAPALSGQTATLTTGLGGEIVVDKNVTIDASGLSAGLTIDGGAGTNRIFSVSSGKSLALLGLTLTGGNGGGAAQNGNGGAIVNFGTLALTRCTLSGNSGGSGGAILNDGGTMALAQCTLSGNSTSNGGAILQTTGTLTLTQCTLAGNQASNDGGAIYNQTGALTLTHCTLSGNSASSWGGAIRNLLTSLTLANSLVAGNGATFGGSDIFSNSTPTPTGVNFIGNPAGCGLTAGPSIRTTAANGLVNLSPLGSNGGPTKTMVPRPGSPAIDVPSFITGVTTDQRGFPRPVENGPSGGLPDIGAVESQTVVVTTAADQIDTPTGAQTSLREALRDGADRVVFSPALAFQSVGLDSQISVAKYVTIDASSIANGLIPSGMIVSANDVSRIFHIAPGVTAEFIRLMITTGQAATNVFPDGYGGGAYVEGALTLTECTLQGNSAYVGGAAYVANSATAFLTLQRCTVSGNTASYGGGIQNEGTLLGQSSTFAENTATQDGGAISAPFGKPVTLKHCTVSRNTAGTGGGVIGSNITVENTIITGNTAASGADYSGTLNFVGTNIGIGNALLAPLGDYGGPTRTMALLPGSPASNNAVHDPAFTTDQRGFPIVNTPDIGAYEAGTFTNFNAWIWESLPATATPPQHATTFDFDGDGQTNEKEWVARTDPTSNASYFRVVQTVISGANFNVTFPTVSGRSYQLQSSPNLANPWANIGSPTPGTGGNVTLPVSIGSETRYFFRVSVQ